MRIGFIGVGNMGEALARAISAAGYSLVLSDHSREKTERLAIELPEAILASNEDLIETCQVIFLGVKPPQVVPVLKSLSYNVARNPSALWVSMSAGLSIESIADFLPQEAGLIRMMPNTSVAIGHGMTTYAVKDGDRAEADRSLFEQLMAKTGQVLHLPENLLDAATGIAGCGPAFVYQFIEALADAGVQNGLTRADSFHLAAQTLSGAAQMVLNSQQHPAVLRDQVASPGGSTIAGLVALEEANFRYATIKAVNRAVERTKELGQSF